MRLHCASFQQLCARALTAVALLHPSVALGQTWSAPRTTPALWELVAVDGTGEPAWPFGPEDIAADGRSFLLAEQGVDIRSAYATADSSRLWLRAYVSSTQNPATNLRLYVFVDADGDRSTGGSADAGEIEAAFATDPSGGGYEHVLGFSGTGTVLGLWDYQEQQALFEQRPGAMPRVEAEVGTDSDPLRLGAHVRGFIGGSVELSVVPVEPSCEAADLFFRAVSDDGNDLDVGPRADCVASDRDGNRVPDRVEEVSGCDADEQCPAGGRCISGACRFAPACSTAAECAAGSTCEDERCVAIGGESCDGSAQCDGLTCLSGVCSPCTANGATCASGRACAPDGRCVSGTAGPAGDSASLVGPDERVQGGAFTCGLSRAPGGAGFLGFALGLVLLRLRRSQNQRGR